MQSYRPARQRNRFNIIFVVTIPINTPAGQVFIISPRVGTDLDTIEYVADAIDMALVKIYNDIDSAETEMNAPITSAALNKLFNNN